MSVFFNYRNRVRRLELLYEKKRSMMDIDFRNRLIKAKEDERAAEALLMTRLHNKEKEVEKRLSDLALACANDTADYEHAYHHSMEEKKVELARLDALIEAKNEVLKTDREVYDFMIKEKNETIGVLQKSLADVISKLGCPTQDVISKPTR